MKRYRLTTVVDCTSDEHPLGDLTIEQATASLLAEFPSDVDPAVSVSVEEIPIRGQQLTLPGIA